MIFVPQTMFIFLMLMQKSHGINYRAIFKRAESIDSSNDGAENKPASKMTSFEEWRDWEKKFPSCSPANNEFLSPINIVTSTVVNDTGQTLIVYSGAPIPIGGYTFNTRLLHEGKVALDIATIGVRGEKTREATYISGLGSKELRYFHKAMFLFSLSDLESERSLHQINGTKFPMEIVMYFKDVRNEESTQIHVLVKQGETIHPGFHWLPYLLHRGVDTAQAIDDNKHIKIARDEFGKANLEAKRLLAAEKADMDGDTYSAAYQDLKLLYSMVQNAQENHTNDLESQTKVLNDEMTSIQAQTGTINDEKIDLESKLRIAQDAVRNQIAQGVLLKGQENEETDQVKSLQSKLRKVSEDSEAKITAYRTISLKLRNVERELQDLKGILQRFKIGSMPGAIFPNVEAVKAELDVILQKKKKIEPVLDVLANKRFELEEALVGQSNDIPLEFDTNDAYFQISWLLPPIGGFFSYKGSSMIPPCTPQPHVIVMELPITISKEQFTELFAKIPRGRTKQQIEDGAPITYFDKMVPPIRDLGKRVVMYNRKNLQFKFDDGLHMKSSERRKIKDKLANNCATFHYRNYISTILICILPAIVIDYFNYYN